MSDEAKRVHELITTLRNEGYDVAYGAAENEGFPEHVDRARDDLTDPSELMGFFLVVMREGTTDYHGSTVVSGSNAAGVAQIQMLGAHFRSVLEHTGLDASTLVEAMVDEALTIDTEEPNER